MTRSLPRRESFVGQFRVVDVGPLMRGSDGAKDLREVLTTEGGAGSMTFSFAGFLLVWFLCFFLGELVNFRVSLFGCLFVRLFARFFVWLFVYLIACLSICLLLFAAGCLLSGPTIRLWESHAALEICPGNTLTIDAVQAKLWRSRPSFDAWASAMVLVA